MLDAKTILSWFGIRLTDEQLEQVFIRLARETGKPLIEERQPDGSWRIVGLGSLKEMRRLYRKIGMKPSTPFERLRERYITQ